MIDRSATDWYKDALIYQLHIKAFFDSSNDGIGDLRGLIARLDYIKALGVTAIWLLPFYPSPLRDDGYDIAEYTAVNPAYGTLEDAKDFIDAAHEAGLRVITELVINHTSDQHPWFQRARTAPKGSPERNFYVWSDDDKLYSGTRIIFCDTEPSNWTWDPVAEQYYWHRFYAHQPDLNFDNPEVLQAVLGILHFWLEAGVDGLRLDAVPYLIERDGTNNENLPETHAVLKRIRAEVDAHYPDRMLLAEANQWPEDTRDYFGDGDECHMAFHFPLMPRMYMALAEEDRHPITDIMRQTPDIPEAAQWAIFLRNHDELTLEMVTDKERDYLWNFYASDRRMRINMGIRRRLAPLMENDRRKVELLNALLFSMPGTPVLYYGDEIGMGDNVFLGDRDGVRTPMQWSPDRNGGFSRADPALLYLPPIMDPIYGYGAINVESQERNSASLLNWMKRMIAVRRASRAFGRGTLRFLYPGNRKIFAYLREFETETILCVANMARSAQAVELDLSQFSGRVPVEMLSQTPFPRIGELPYLLSLAPYGFYWFTLSEVVEAPAWSQSGPISAPEFITLVIRNDRQELGLGRNRERLETESLPAFLPTRRWFGGKGRRIEGVSLVALETLDQHRDFQIALIEVRQKDELTRYQIPLGVIWNEAATEPGSACLPFVVAQARRFNRIGAVVDAQALDRLALTLFEAMRGREPIASSHLEFWASDAALEIDLGPEPEVRSPGAEQSNTSVIIANQVMIKILRRIQPGIHPELEMTRYLALETEFDRTPELLASLEHVDETGERAALALAQRMVFNQGDAWAYLLERLDADLERRHLGINGDAASDAAPEEMTGDLILALVDRIGERTGGLHRALAGKTDDPDFAPERITEADLAAWAKSATEQAEAAFATLQRGGGAAAQDLLARREEAIARLQGMQRAPDALKTRVHGDYHLGQVLVAERDVYIIDFEGEPRRPLSERRAKISPMKDVAGMLRSFDYLAWTTAMRLGERYSDALDELTGAALAWRDEATERFLAAYREALGDCGVWPEDEAEAKALLDLFLLEKAFYEISYEAESRPAWLHIPVSGVVRLMQQSASGGTA